jgi:addiction module RelE/StbE family toxin
MANRAPFCVDWAPPARADAEAIVDYIAQARPGTAASILDRILQAAASLRAMPLRGRTVPELAEVGINDYRELIVRPWRVVYKIEGEKVRIVAVVDSRRDLAGLLLERVARLSSQE